MRHRYTAVEQSPKKLNPWRSKNDIAVTSYFLHTSYYFLQMPFHNLHITAQSQHNFTMDGLAFVNEFANSQEHTLVANTIYYLLINKLEYPINQLDHPFNRYADGDANMEDIINTIRVDALDNLQNETQFTRSLVRSFCANGGIYREALEDLLESYFMFVLLSTE